MNGDTLSTTMCFEVSVVVVVVMYMTYSLSVYCLLHRSDDVLKSTTHRGDFIVMRLGT